MGASTMGVRSIGGGMNNSTELSNMDPKVVAGAKKAVSSPKFKRFATELKRASLTNHKGCVSVKNFLAIISMFEIDLSQREIGAILRVFRSRGLADTVTFQGFLDVCASV